MKEKEILPSNDCEPTRLESSLELGDGSMSGKPFLISNRGAGSSWSSQYREFILVTGKAHSDLYRIPSGMSNCPF